MTEQEQGIGREGSGQLGIQSPDNQLSMSATESPTDPIEAALTPKLKSLLGEIRNQPGKGPVVHNGERGLGSNW